ncbi:MAG: acyltransferase [Bacteroidetes bacterium]|nr:MAG: acyltransferase [Bacteroidota bacterium]
MKKFILKILLKFYLIGKNQAKIAKYLKYRKNFDIDDSFSFNGDDIIFYGTGNIKCGQNSYIGNYSTILADEGVSVQIGDYCRISHNVRIYSSSAIADQNFENYSNLKKYTGDVKIGKAVWIGANVFINPGITIGNNAVIGANSVVTKDIPDNAVFGGVPAKLIRYKKYNA